MDWVIFATSNEGKLKEIKEILSDLPLTVQSMKEINLFSDVEETGETFEENATIKASEVARLAYEKFPNDRIFVLADDSGLEVDAMNKEPGVYSARYLGEETSYEIKNQTILSNLQKVSQEKRTARFVCAIACVFPDHSMAITKGTMEGQIADKPYGTNGFGYDPIFYIPKFGKTTAQLTPEEKNAISHRGVALRAMKQKMVEWMQSVNV